MKPIFPKPQYAGKYQKQHIVFAESGNMMLSRLKIAQGCSLV